MTDRFRIKTPLYPVVSISVALLTLVGALLLAKTAWGLPFVVGVFLLLCCFGYLSVCLRLLPLLAVYLGVFAGIFYLVSGDPAFTCQMLVRMSGVFVAVIPGLTMPPVNLIRCLTALHCPRLVSLGMLITLSFLPVLAGEIRQVRSAMRTRGVTGIWNPTVFYRAFLIPLLVRLVNISDTLALSVETRGFVAEGVDFTVYHPVTLRARDLCFAVLFGLLLLGGIALGLILGVQL